MLDLCAHLALPDPAVLAPAAAGASWWPASFLAPSEANEPGLSSGLSVVAALLDELAGHSIVEQEAAWLRGRVNGKGLDMTDAIEITREEGDSKGRYVAVVDGHQAEMTYSRVGASTIIIDHTGVPDGLRGRGVGLALVRRGVEDARAEGRTIIPLCPFAKAQIARHPEWHDVLKR